MDNNHLYFQSLNWEDVRDEVMAVNPELASIIDAISPDKRYPFVKARYRFGDLIVKNGETFLPSPEGPLSIKAENLQQAIKDQLAYSAIPLFLILKNANEVFINLSTRPVPLNLYYPGSLLGLFESMDSVFARASCATWSVSAGARNIFTLPKINEINGFKKLKMAYGLNDSLRPTGLLDHWRIFCEISRHHNFQKHWHNDILFFTKNWLINNHKDSEWFNFKNYLFTNAWHQAQFAIGKINLGLAWEYFSEALVLRRLKPLGYLTDQVKHIILIAGGYWPGFKPADASDQVGPVSDFQKVIANVYALKKYYPTIMHASSLERDASGVLYYSLSHPSLLEGFPNDGKVSTLMSGLREIKTLIDTIKPVFNDCTKMKTDALSKIEFDYFHVEEDKYGEIKKSNLLLDLDTALVADGNDLPEKMFCETSQFWRGTVRIARNKQV